MREHSRETLLVRAASRVCARLDRRTDGRFTFRYEEDWRRAGFALSHSLPLDGAWGDLPQVPSFFVNLLPEGRVREVICRQLGLSVDNDFGLLRAIGQECAGALSLVPESAAAAEVSSPARRLEPEELARLIKARAVLPGITASHPVRLSLAGAQDKLPVRLDSDGTLFVPGVTQPSTHILKVPQRDFRHLPDAEVFTMHLAQAVGLEVPAIDLLHIGGHRVAAIERFDRRRDENDVTRLHQEDFCQVFGIPPSRKYEEDGAVTFPQIFHHVGAHSTNPFADTRRLVTWQLFNLLAGNADGHAKNLAMLRDASRGWHLAPHYDLVCTRVYEHVDRRLAFGIGDQRDPGHVGRAAFEAWAGDLNVKASVVLREVERLGERLLDVLDDQLEAHRDRYGDCPVLERIAIVIRRQVRRTRSLIAA
ncbi:MAG: type II toxin-antitoxin system HipA family toxin [Planctomycetes bacterium]|nr:type II toxin-antitoxin system HipA family toxin [Planctomycetota bacterium]